MTGTMKIITTLTLVAELATPAFAQQKAEDHSAHHPPDTKVVPGRVAVA
jgi:hypothetical protein